MRERSIAVVGSLNRDVVVSVSGLPGRGETVLGSHISEMGGGKGANQAVAAAISGAGRVHVGFVGAIGDDDAGKDEIDQLRAAGVDVSAVVSVDDVSTGAAFVMVEPSGENQIVVVPGANARLSGVQVTAALQAMRPQLVLVSLEISDEAVHAAVATGSELGAAVVLNPAPYRRLAPQVYADVDVITPNQVEFEQLFGTSPETADPRSAAEAVAAHMTCSWVATLGGTGAMFSAGGSPQMIPAPVVEVVDSTGAGDAFNGALAARLGTGPLNADAVTYAVSVAARSVTTPGARLRPE